MFRNYKISPIYFLILILLFLQIITSCNKLENEANSRFPLAESSGVDPLALLEAYDEADDLPNLLSLLVSKDNTIIAEEYYNGHGPDDLHEIKSVTKSFISALVGIVIDQGYISSVNQTIGELLINTEPDLSGPVTEVTLYQLLTMTTGQEWSEIPGPSEFSAFVNSPDQLIYALSKPFVATPGTVFNYSDGAPHIVSAILSEATGQSAFEFAGEQLLSKIGVDHYDYYIDNRGISYGGIGLMITSRNMVSFGNLYLDGGIANGIQVIPGEWIADSFESHITTNNIIPHGSNYGYYWWSGIEYGHQIYFAMGYGGQFIVLVPEYNLVVVATNMTSNVSSPVNVEWMNTINLIFNRVLPAVDGF